MKRTLPAIITGIVAVIVTLIATHAFIHRSKAEETIVVTGLAEKDFNSDLIVWSGSYSRKSMDLKSAYAALKSDESAINAYLVKKGVSNGEMVFSAIAIDKQFTPKLDAEGKNIGQDFTGYQLSQTVNIQSTNIDKIDRISREATELIETGIEFNSAAPLFYNTKLSQVKMELLGKASADAHSRAEAIAENSGSTLGPLKKATMGVFQITGRNSNEDFSSGGDFNTADRYKTGSITIRMEFSVD